MEKFYLHILIMENFMRNQLVEMQSRNTNSLICFLIMSSSFMIPKKQWIGLFFPQSKVMLVHRII